MDGWHNDPAYLRPTVLYGDTVPSPVAPGAVHTKYGPDDSSSVSDADPDGEVALPDALALALAGTQGRSVLSHDTEAPTAPGVRAMAVSVRPGKFTLPRTAVTDGNLALRVALPAERVAAQQEAYELGGKYQLPPVIIPRLPVAATASASTLWDTGTARSTTAVTAGGRLHTRKPLPALPPAKITATSVVFANGNPHAAAEVYMSVALQVKRTALPPLSGSVQTIGSTRADLALKPHPFALPAEFQVLPVEVATDTWSHSSSAAEPQPQERWQQQPSSRSAAAMPAHSNPAPGQYLFRGGSDDHVGGDDGAADCTALVASGAGAGAGAANTSAGDAAGHTSPHPETVARGLDPAFGTTAVFLDPHDGAGPSLPPPSAMTGMFVCFLPGAEGLALRLPPSVADDVPVVFEFCNSHMEHDMETYWVDYDGQLTRRRSLGPGQAYSELTWATHPWVVRNSTTLESVLVCVGPGCVAEPMGCSLVWNSGPCTCAAAWSPRCVGWSLPPFSFFFGRHIRHHVPVCVFSLAKRRREAVG